MQRREFLIRVGGAFLAAPVILEVIGCGNDPAAVADGFDVENDLNDPGDDGHLHVFRIECSQLSSTTEQPVTATGSNHTHNFKLQPSDLQSIAAGNEVEVITNDIHPHVWKIRKPSGVC